MPKRTDLEAVLIIGAGPIVIGQASEFDYSGAQACKALREEGYKVILVNSNPATIMTDPEMADVVRRKLEAGQLGGLGLRTDDCRKAFDELSGKGVTFLQEPADRPYGVEAVIRDNTGNWIVLVEPKEFDPADLS